DRREDRKFLDATLKAHGVRSYEIVSVTGGAGMMPNVHEGLTRTAFALDQPLLIHVADIFRHHFVMPQPIVKTLTADFVPVVQGLPRRALGPLEIVMHGKGIGCYHISSAQDFVDAYGR